MRYTLANDIRTPGFFFEDGVSREEVITFVRHPEARKWLPYPVFLHQPVGDGFFASSEVPRLCYPNEALPGVSFEVIHDASVEPFSLHARFDNCTQLIKVMGCGHCDMKGDACLRSGKAPESALRSDAATPRLDTDAFLTWVKKNTVGETEFVHPSRTWMKHFQDTLRPAEDHSFKEIEANDRDRSKAAKLAAETRARIRTDCSRCMFGQKNSDGSFRPGCDDRPRYCNGPFDTEDAQVNHVIAEWDPKVEAFLTTGEFTRGQFWAIARESGMEATYNRKKVLLTGWRYKGAFELEFYRAKTYISRVPVRSMSYGELRETFTRLPGVTGDVQTPGPKARALWYLSLTHSTMARRVGWGHRHRDLVVRQVVHNGVELKQASPYYCYYGTVSHTSMYASYLDFRNDPPVRLQRGQK